MINFCVANFSSKLATIPASTSPNPGSSALAVAGNCNCMSASTWRRRTSNDADGTKILGFSDGAGGTILKDVFIKVIRKADRSQWITNNVNSINNGVCVYCRLLITVC